MNTVYWIAIASPLWIWLPGLLWFLYQLRSRKFLVFSVKQVLTRFSLFIFLPLYLLILSLGIATDEFGRAFSNTNSFSFAWLCSGVFLIFIGAILLVAWLSLRKYSFLVFNAPCDRIAEEIAQCLKERKFEYAENYPQFNIGNGDAEINLTDNYTFTWITVRPARLGPSLKVDLEHRIFEKLQNAHSSHTSTLATILLIFLPYFLFMPLDFLFPNTKIYLIGDSEGVISRLSENIGYGNISIILKAFVLLFSIFAIIFGIQGLTRRPFAINIKAPSLGFIVLALIANLLMILESGLGLAALSSLSILVLIALAVIKMPPMFMVWNAHKSMVLESFKSVFENQGVHFTENRSKLYLPRFGASITMYADHHRRNGTSFVVEGESISPEVNSLLKNFFVEIKAKQYDRFNFGAIVPIVIGLTLIFFILPK